MKAAICYEFGRPLVIEEINIDPPQAGEVKVKLAACAICHSDIHYIDGAWGGVLPALYGHEAAGVVTEVGPQVLLVKPGDKVVVTLIRSCGRCYFCLQGQPHLCEGDFALNHETRLHTRAGRPVFQGLRTGAFAEYVVVDQSQVVPVCVEMPLDSASLLACGVITGLGAVTNAARVPAGSSVVVVGVGGVGLNTVQGAFLSGAQPIIAIDPVNRKLVAAKRFGATHTLIPAGENLAAAVRALTQGRGADYVFVTVGNAQVMEQSLALVRRAGTLVLVGMPAVGAKLQLEAVDLADNAQQILGSKMGSTRLQVDVPKLMELYEQGRLKLDELITARYPLAEINEAIAAVKRGEALRNGIVF